MPQTPQTKVAEVLTERQAEEHGDPHRGFYLLVLLLKDVWGVLKLIFSYTLDESSFVMLLQDSEKIISDLSFDSDT